MAATGNARSAAVRAAPPASAPPRTPPRRSGSRRRCRRRLGCVAPVPRRPATRLVERSGPKGRETSADRSASRPHIARAEVHGRFQRGSWLSPCPNPSLAARASPKSGSFPRPELCCLGGHQYYYPVRLPLHCSGLRLWPYTRASFRGYRPLRGCSRVSPVACVTFAACRLPYAGGAPGCSRIQGPECCLRPFRPGSTPSAPYGIGFRRGRVQVPYGLQLCFTSLRLRLSAVTGDFTTGLLWRLTRAGLSPAGHPDLPGRYAKRPLRGSGQGPVPEMGPYSAGQARGSLTSRTAQSPSRVVARSRSTAAATPEGRLTTEASAPDALAAAATSEAGSSASPPGSATSWVRSRT